MCGICGIFNYADIVQVIDHTLIERMCRQMAHRGPDDEGAYVSPDAKLGLGHRRLSIIDLSPAGHQPMCNEDGSIWITFNGEIYNHAKLREELLKKGHIYRSHSDTETIIHQYEESGPECVQKFEGMFAFAIWDIPRRRLFLARDRLGVKPLYYTFAKGTFLFASEIKAILECPLVTARLDRAAMYHYLTLVTTPAPRTMFEGISKLPPGHYMLVGTDGQPRIHQYWEAIIPAEIKPQPEEYYIERLRQLLAEAIQKRMMSDVPFGVFLSGGVDSSLNVALMSTFMNRPVDTFTVGFEQNQYDEFQYARQIAKDFGTNHHEVLINDQSFLDILPRMVHHQDEPLADPVCVPLHYVSKLTRDNGTIVIQVGEGSDEVFFGYEAYARVLETDRRFWRRFAPLPSAFKKLAYNLTGWAFDTQRRDVLHRAKDSGMLFWGSAFAFGELEKSRLLNSQSGNGFSGLNTFDEILPYYNKLKQVYPKSSLMEWMVYNEMKIRLPELLLMRIDKMTMLNSIEARVPFLDHKLVEFALTIPLQLRLKKGYGKYILKKAAQGLIPDEIIWRHKQGFCGSSSNMLTPRLLDYAEQTILNSRFARETFNLDYIKHTISQQRQGREDKTLRLWNLLNLVLWHQHWIG